LLEILILFLRAFVFFNFFVTFLSILAFSPTPDKAFEAAPLDVEDVAGEDDAPDVPDVPPEVEEELLPHTPSILQTTSGG